MVALLEPPTKQSRLVLERRDHPQKVDDEENATLKKRQAGKRRGENAMPKERQRTPQVEGQMEPPAAAVELVKRYKREAEEHGMRPFDYVDANRALLYQLFGIEETGAAIRCVLGFKSSSKVGN